MTDPAIVSRWQWRVLNIASLSGKGRASAYCGAEATTHMAFLDFLKKRQQQTVAPKPQQTETAKQMYGREAAVESAAVKPVTPELKAQAARVMTAMDKASHHLQPASAKTASETAGSPAAQLQNQHGQGSAQPALSPTDGANGKTVTQDQVKPLPTPKKPQQTMARQSASWER